VSSLGWSLIAAVGAGPGVVVPARSAERCQDGHDQKRYPTDSPLFPVRIVDPFSV